MNLRDMWDAPCFPGFGRLFGGRPVEHVAVQTLEHPPNVVLPSGFAYSFCHDCSSSRGRGQRCTTSEDLHRLRNLGGVEMLRASACPLDLADELRRRADARAAVQHIPDSRPPEPKRKTLVQRLLLSFRD
jgi:hypothetical protein